MKQSLCLSAGVAANRICAICCAKCYAKWEYWLHSPSEQGSVILFYHVFFTAFFITAFFITALFITGLFITALFATLLTSRHTLPYPRSMLSMRSKPQECENMPITNNQPFTLDAA
ncbi:MAG: hypothetical protein ACRDCM_03065 [Plesiomonas shigelloides]